MASDETQASVSSGSPVTRSRRADAQRNVDALLTAAKAVFATSGVDAPAKQITDLAGLGVGTLYRHFPRRSDLVVAVITHDIDACAAAAHELAARHEPWPALTAWVDQLTALVSTKRGLATALHSGDPAFADLPNYFTRALAPAVDALLDAARTTGDVRAGITGPELLTAVALLCQPVAGEALSFNERMVRTFTQGLRQA
jgi:AcrR family transcriptional regulator